MSDRFQTKIEIGGPLDRAHLDELDDLASEWEIDWTDRATRRDIEQASATRTPLELTDNELTYGGHETLAAFCQTHQLPYKVTIDGKYEYTGEVRVWAPGRATELLQTATNDGNAVLALSELRQLEEGGKTLADAIRFLAGFDEFTLPALELLGDQDVDEQVMSGDERLLEL
jgi:hypothetical protein